MSEVKAWAIIIENKIVCNMFGSQFYIYGSEKDAEFSRSVLHESFDKSYRVVNCTIILDEKNEL